jgi:hypothetical protein
MCAIHIFHAILYALAVQMEQNQQILKKLGSSCADAVRAFFPISNGDVFGAKSGEKNKKRCRRCVTVGTDAAVRAFFPVRTATYLAPNLGKK